MPNRIVAFLTRDEVLEIHHALLDRFGGPPGVRDQGLLESALYRPQTGYYADLAEIAAAPFESLIINHPFVDGNIRIALFARSLSDLGDRSEHGGRTRQKVYDFEAHSGPTQREIGDFLAALPSAQ